MTPLPTLVQSLRFDDKEYFSTPQVNRGLQALNRCIGSLSGGRISPVRFQTKPANLRSRKKHELLYIKRKSKEVVETALEFIAPGQSSELLTRITTPSTTKEPSPENKIVATLVLLYQGATSWYTKMTILSIFVKHYSKSKLKAMEPDLRTWRIDQTRKHSAIVGEGVYEEREPKIYLIFYIMILFLSGTDLVVAFLVN